jgi:uncharacterized protein with ATP-grasp and redox domains
MIDCGASATVTTDQVRASLHEALDAPFHADTEAFHGSLSEAGNVLYLADNAGEITVDRLLIEQIGADRVTLVVRGGPVINDATLADATEAGLVDAVEVVGNGSDAPGTVLNDCSEEVRRRFLDADLIVAKGQGNYESLCDAEANVFFLFKIKCPLVARRTGLAVGTQVLLPGADEKTTPTRPRT